MSSRTDVLKQYVEEIGMHGVLALLSDVDHKRQEAGWARVEAENAQLRESLETCQASNRRFVEVIDKQHRELADALGIDRSVHGQPAFPSMLQEARDLREAYSTPTALIHETRDTLKSVGFQVPEGVHLLDTVNKALKHHAGRAKDATEKFDLMEKTLMDERDQAVATAMAEQEQRKVWEQSSNQWHDHFKDREAQLADVRKDFLSLEADYRSLESINKMQEGLINASNARIAELEKGIELANTSRNLYKDASSANYERARAAELKLIKRKMREGDVGYNFSFVTNDGRNINNPCAHCGEQIPIEYAAIYNVKEGYALHFACESAWKEKNGRNQDG